MIRGFGATGQIRRKDLPDIMRRTNVEKLEEDLEFEHAAGDHDDRDQDRSMGSQSDPNDVQIIEPLIDLTRKPLVHSGIMVEEDACPWPYIRDAYIVVLRRTARLVSHTNNLRKQLNDAASQLKYKSAEWLLDRDKSIFVHMFRKTQHVLNAEWRAVEACNELLKRSDYNRIFQERIMTTAELRLERARTGFHTRGQLIRDLIEVKDALLQGAA